MKLLALRAVALALCLVIGPAYAATEPDRTIHRIGYLSPGPGYPFEPFRDELQTLGYVEGRNLVIERRSAEGDPELLHKLAGELVQLRVEVIVTATTAATQAAQRATSTIPIVFALADDPVGLGLVASLPKPGGNITGLTGLIVELTSKRLELIKEALPKTRRVAVLWGPYPISTAALKEAQGAGRKVGLELQPVEIRKRADLEAVFGRMRARHVQALLVLPHPIFVAERAQIVQLAGRHRLPAMYYLREFVDAGGLMSYSPDVEHMARSAAVYVDKILKGAAPAELPVEQPTKFELAINLKTAKALGITVPDSVLLRAEQVTR